MSSSNKSKNLNETSEEQELSIRSK